jgi:hypothetical protein
MTIYVGESNGSGEQLAAPEKPYERFLRMSLTNWIISTVFS